METSNTNPEVIKKAIAAFSSLTRGNARLEAEGMTWAQLVTNFSTVFPKTLDSRAKRELAYQHLKEALNFHFGEGNWVTPKLEKEKGEGRTVWVFVINTPGHLQYLKNREKRHAEE